MKIAVVLCLASEQCKVIFSHLWLFCTANQTKLSKIKVSQNNCIRCIFFANKRESPTPYFTLLEILKLENIFKLKIGALVHKIQYQKKDTPPALYDLVQPASAVHNYNTRYATNQNLCRPFSRTNYGLARFSVVASQTWEATPMKIKCLPLNSFKKEYKLFLLDSQASWTTLICYLALFI